MLTLLNQCPAVYQAEPSIELGFVPITDECAGSVGLRAQYTVTGEPPFKLHYRISHGSSTRDLVKTFTSYRDEIVFQPEQLGQFTWQAVKLEDSLYKGDRAIQLASRKLLQKTEIHPLASASFHSSSVKEAHSCDGPSISTMLDLTVRVQPAHEIAI